MRWKPTFAGLAYFTLVSAATGAEIEVRATADTVVCVQTMAQCIVSGSGHVVGKAAATNHNPVRLMIHVEKTGVPVGGLTLQSFKIAASFGPAGAPPVDVCTEQACSTYRFQAVSGGSYAIFLDPGRVRANWKKGTYTGSVSVVSGADAGTTQFSFEIPAN